MTARKYSRQRELIKQSLQGRKDHPTAEMVYAAIREEHPQISLGTVYRNLSLLVEMGEIQKLSIEDGPYRFDWNTEPHYHFFCRQCHAVTDMEVGEDPVQEKLPAIQSCFSGRIERYTTEFYGICNNCLQAAESY